MGLEVGGKTRGRLGAGQGRWADGLPFPKKGKRGEGQLSGRNLGIPAWTGCLQGVKDAAGFSELQTPKGRGCRPPEAPSQPRPGLKVTRLEMHFRALWEERVLSKRLTP